MSNDTPFYTSEIQRLLKIGDNLIVGKKTAILPHDLPVIQEVAVEEPLDIPVQAEHDLPSQKSEHISDVLNPEKQQRKFFKSDLIVYPVIFLVAFVFFYSVLNFGSLTNQVFGWFAQDEDQQILGDDLTAYYAWMSGYYFSVGNAELLEPAGDIDKDGLSNMDEFLIKTNPTVADSDLDGFSDGIEIINSTNPWGAGAMTQKQAKLVTSLDVIKVSNRISFNVATNTAPVLGSTKINFDLNQPGRLSVPKLNMQVPIIWTKDPKDFETDLTKGVVHYPGTALPGEQGTVYISGHSSDYPWKRHEFKQVFARLNSLDVGDDIFVDVYDAKGKLYNYRYRVSAKNIYKPDDQTQFIDNSAAKLNLSTCWPIGTAKDRYVVSAILEGV